jgi:hypothetical protein
MEVWMLIKTNFSPGKKAHGSVMESDLMCVLGMIVGGAAVGSGGHLTRNLASAGHGLLSGVPA